MSRLWKRMLSMVLALMMVLGAVPMQAFATESETIPESVEHTHTYVGTVTTEATCTAEGVMTYVCDCEDSYTETIAPKGHTYENGVCACGENEPVQTPEEGEDAPVQTPEVDEAVAAVQAMIDALPGVEKYDTSLYSSEDAYIVALDDLRAQLRPVEAAMNALTEEQGAALNIAKYEAAVNVIVAYIVGRTPMMIAGSGTQADPYVVTTSGDAIGYADLYAALAALDGLTAYSVGGYRVNGNAVSMSSKNTNGSISAGNSIYQVEVKKNYFYGSWVGSGKYIKIVKVEDVSFKATSAAIQYNFFYAADASEQELMSKIYNQFIDAEASASGVSAGTISLGTKLGDWFRDWTPYEFGNDGDGSTETFYVKYGSAYYGPISITLNESRTAASVTFAESVTATVTDSDQPIKDAAIAAATASNGGTLSVTAISGTMPTVNNPSSEYTVTVEAAANGTALKGSNTVTVTANLGKVNVFWKNEDGTTLDSDEVYYGATPVYGGDTPTKAADVQYTYTFNTWSPAVGAVTEDTTYTATYSETLNKYDVTFKNWDDAVLAGPVKVDYGTSPAYNGETPAKPQGTNIKPYAFVGWTDGETTSADLSAFTVTGNLELKAVFEEANGYLVTFKQADKVVATRFVNTDKGETTVSDLPDAEDPYNDNMAFASWMDADQNAFTANTVVTGDMTVTAMFVQDSNNNNVPDSLESAVIKLNVVGAEYGDVTFAHIDTVIIDGEAVIFDSTKTDGNVITVTATPKATGNTYSKNELVGETPAPITLEANKTYTVNVEFKTTTLTLNSGKTVYVNKETWSDRITGFKEEVLSAVVGGYTNNAGNYTVVVNGSLSNYNLDNLDTLGTTGLATLLLGNEAKVTITDKTTGLYGSVTVALADSRSAISITTSNVTISAKEEPADLAQQVKKAISIKAVNPKTGAETAVNVSDSYINYGDYVWPGDAEEKTFTVTVKVNSDATFIGATKTLTLTCTDTTIMYTVTYQNGVDADPLYIQKHAENTATPVIDDPTREYYTFAGWIDENGNGVAEKVTEDVVYTAQWTPILDINCNNTADEEETYTVIYTDGVEGEEVFADAVTSNLAYGAATPAAPEVPAREGWNFKGWNVESIPATVSAPESGNTITYTALWSEAWVVTFEGHTYKTPAEVEDGEKITEPIDIWDDDHDFLGWFNGDEKYDFSTPVESNLTLTAKWRTDYNRNDIEDTTEEKFTVIYVDGEAELDKFEDVLVGMPTPKIDDPIKTGYKFDGWKPAVTETVTADVTYVAQWLNDRNNNGVDDAEETISITVNKADDGDEVAVTGADLIEGKYIFDSTGDKKITIVATPVVEKGKSATFVSGVTAANGAGEYDSNFVYTYTFDAVNGDQITVDFAKAEFTFNEQRQMSYYTGMKNVAQKDLYDIIASAPDYDAADSVTITYMAREAMTHKIAIDSLDFGEGWLADLAKSALKNANIDGIIEDGNILVKMEPLWLDVDVENNDPFPESMTLDQAVQKYLGKDVLSSMIQSMISDIVAGDWDKIGDRFKEAFAPVYEAAKYDGAHRFGYNPTGAEVITEKIKLTYANGAMYIEGQTTVDLKDTRAITQLTGSNVTLTYRNFTDEELIAAINPTVTDENGAVVEGAKATTVQIGDGFTYTDKSVNETGYEITFKFAGNEQYRPCEKTFVVSIAKASLSMDLPDVMATYGEAYNAMPTYTMGNAYGQREEIDASLIRFVVGLDIADLDVNGDGVTGLTGKMQLILTEDLQKAVDAALKLAGKDPVDGVELSISELMDVLSFIDNDMLGTLGQALESIQGIVENYDLTITLGGEMPKDSGAYLYGAITTSTNYETAFDVGYIVIAPAATQVYLDWNYHDANHIYTWALLEKIDINASAFNDTAFSEKNEAATEQVHELFFGIDEQGNVVAKLDSVSQGQQLGTGAFVELAFVAEFGNEFYYAVPIARPVVIVPNMIDVEIVDANENGLLLREFDNTPKAVEVKVTLDGQEMNKDCLTVNYVGVKTNTQTYNSTVAPTNAGAYVVTATYLEKNEDGDITGVGIDVATLIIEPTEATIDVAEKIVTVDSEKSYNLEETLVTVGSTVAGLTPDTTIISAQINTDGTFSENGWEAIQGSANIDFPAWVDALIAAHAPSVTEGITVGQMKEKLLAKLPELSNKLTELGATEEIVNSFNNLVENVIKAMEKIPDDVTLTFQDNVSVKNVGTYAVIGIVTDSDHYPAVDAGLLVIVPDVDLVHLKWNYEDENGIWTRELLQTENLLATAYDDAAYTTENAEATDKIDYRFVGFNKNGDLVVFDNADKLVNGAYIETAYIALKVDGEMVVSDMIARPVAIIPSAVKVTFVDETGAENAERHFVFDNTPKTMGVKVSTNGQEITPAEGTLTITYTGVQTNGLKYNSTVAPTHAGVYTVTAYYEDLTNEGSRAHVGVAVGIMVIEPAKSTIAVTGGTVIYDGNGHTASVSVTGKSNADYTLISGGAYVSGNINEIGVDAFHGNVNIDFPAWLDQALAAYEFKTEGVDAAYVIRFINAYRDRLVKLIPTEMLVKLGVTEEEINTYVAKLNGYIDELLAVLEKVPEDVVLTFNDGVTYTEPGAYLFYGIVTDSDHYPSADTGLLVIEKKDIAFDLLDTTATWNGNGQMVDLNNPENADFTTVVIDRKNNTINIILDEDAQYILNVVAKRLGVEFDGDVQMSTILEQYNGQEVAEAIVALIDELEKLEKLELSDEIQKVLAAVKEELADLPENGTIILNGQLPTELGTYEVYAISYSQYFKTVAAEAKLEIVPVQVKVSLDDQTKVYGEADPELTYTVKYYDHEGQEMTDVSTEISAVVSREAGETVGTYAITAEVSVADTNFTLVEVTNGTLTITKAEPTITQVPEAVSDLVYNGKDQALVKPGKAEGGELVYSLSEDGPFTTEIPTGLDAGTYTVYYKVAGSENYSDSAVGSVSVTIAGKPIAADDVKLGDALTFNGSEQTQQITVADGITYTVSGNKGTNAGNYTLTVTGTGNYTGTVTLDWSIAKANPSYTMPEGLTATEGDTLADVKLPDGFTWQDAGTTSVGKAGENTFLVTFTPDDTDNYNVVEDIQVTVVVEKNDSKTGLYPIDMSGVKHKTIKPGAKIYVDGVAYTLDDDCVAYVAVDTSVLVTTYVYNMDSKNPHDEYPTHMYVWKLNFQGKKDAVWAEGEKYTAERMEKLDDIMQYSGSSIRISGKKGIRMITSIPTAKRKQLIDSNIYGYQLMQTGTCVEWADENGVIFDSLTLATNPKLTGYAYKRGVQDPVFNRTNGLDQFTNVLIGFNNDQCKYDLVMRPYMILKNVKTGETVVLYGGAVQRSIGYIAYQNRLVYNSGHSAYDFIWDIIHHVYGKKYDADYRG